MQHAQRHAAQRFLAKTVGQTHGGFHLQLVRFFDQRANHVGLPATVGLLADPRINLRAFAWPAHVGPHHPPAGWHLIQHRHVQIAVQGQGQGPWDGRRGHDQHVWVESLVPERGALRYAKLVLLVHHDQPQPGEGDPFFQERVRPNSHLHLSCA